MPATAKTAADESFPVAWLLPPRARPAVHAYYAFARTADDLADAPDMAPEEKLARLDALETALHGGDGPAVGRRLHDAMVARHLPLSLAGDLLTAFRIDARGPHIADGPALMAYCDASAVPVGRFLLALFEETAPAVKEASDHLCRALQILNHLQDLGEDQRLLGRCYMPGDWLKEVGAAPADFAAPALSPAARQVVDRALAAVDASLAGARPLRGLRHRALRVQAMATLTIAHAHRHRLAQADPLVATIRPRRRDWFRALVHGLWMGARP